MPKRIQRKRTKGWKMPDGAVYVGRPTIFGNPYRVGDGLCETPEQAVERYREWIEDGTCYVGDFVPPTEEQLEELRGKDLCCWCREGAVCHADVLLEIANQ